MEATFVRPSVATQQSRGEIVMKRLRILFLFSAVLLFGTGSVFATNYAVGRCEPKLPSYTTISAAVAAVPAGSIVEVCPGTYLEQVTIKTPLTLEGITSRNLDQVIISVPVAGLVLDANGIAAQVEVTAGPVNITNITVDGKDNNAGDTTILVGIFYGANSSGVIKAVTTRNQLNFGLGFGIRADNTNSTQELLTIEDCSVHDFDDAGIYVEGNFTATVNANHVNASNATDFVDGIFVQSAGSITDNGVTGAGISSGGGIIGDFPDLAISGNTVSNWEFGLADLDGAKYTSNAVRNTATGFVSFAEGATVESNTITQAAGAGIEFNCDTGTVKSNTINDAAIAIDNVPSGVISTNTYFNVGAIRNACSSAAIAPAIELKEIRHGNHLR
jgi:hypothetical protein